MLDKPSAQSRALAVNPRTLEILKPTGVTQQMLEVGLRIHGVCFHREESTLAKVSLAGFHPNYPFMLALSQAGTEMLLTRALETAGVKVERGVRLVDCGNSSRGVEAILEPTVGGTREVVRCRWLLAADGAHSTARERVTKAFEGTSMKEEWYLADAPMRTVLPPEYGHVFFLEAGAFLFLLRVVNAERKMAGDPLWRVISNIPNPLAQLTQATQTGPTVWESGFHISHRIAETMSNGGIYLAGDAAHLHSPMGARGMNLGIEDAWVFSELDRTDRLSEYNGLRQPVDRRVVRRVELLTRIAAGESPFTRTVREFAFPAAMKTPILHTRILKALTGLDHPLSI